MPSVWITLALAICIALVALAVLSKRFAVRGGGIGDFSGLVRITLMVYARLLHRLRVEGRENLPEAGDHGPLIVVANHTAGVDALLIQAACPFEVRWIMASDMHLESLDWLWRYARVIFIDRHGGSAAGMRDAVRELRDGGVVGLFPEGGIERPPRSILPFRPGLGLLVKRSGARVLPIIVDGTPVAPTARDSLFKRSRSRLRIMPILDYSKEQIKPESISEDLHHRFVEWTGWRESEQAPIPG